MSNCKRISLFSGRMAVAVFLLQLSALTVEAVDVRETYVFKGPFDMHTARGVTFSFTCEDHRPVTNFMLEATAFAAERALADAEKAAAAGKLLDGNPPR